MRVGVGAACEYDVPPNVSFLQGVGRIQSDRQLRFLVAIKKDAVSRCRLCVLALENGIRAPRTREDWILFHTSFSE